MYQQFFVLLMVNLVCSQDNVLDIAKQRGAMTLVKLLQDAELSSVLKGQGMISYNHYYRGQISVHFTGSLEHEHICSFVSLQISVTVCCS